MSDTSRDTASKILLNTERLLVLRDLALLESHYVTVYDRLTDLATKIIEADVSLMSMVAANYQFFKSHVGLPEPWKSRRQTPLSHSFCKHVVASHTPLVITDAREHDLVKDNLAIPDLNVIGYLGMPLTLEDGSTLGSFCVIDGQPREWTPVEIDIMQELAQVVIKEFNTRVEVRRATSRRSDLEALHKRIHAFIDELDIEAPKKELLEQLRTGRSKYRL